MKQRSAWVLAGTTVLLAAAVGVGCTTETNGGDGKTGAGGEGSANSTSTSTSTSTSSGGGGNNPGDCNAEAESYCTAFEACAANRFIGQWENQEICRAERAKSCSSGAALDGTNGVEDEAGCAAARTSCAGILNPASIFDACKPKPGDFADQTECIAAEQCANLNCYRPPGEYACPGTCDSPFEAGQQCDQSSLYLCDYANGAQCLFTVETVDNMDTVIMNTTCEYIVYGGAGAKCYASTNLQCKSGFECSNQTHTCVNAIAAGAPCAPTDSLCDTDLELSCQVNDDGIDVCTPPVFVKDGAQCGLVDGAMQLCSAYALCNTEDTTVCVLRKREGETCTATPIDNCYPGLSCKGGTCQVGDPPDCPAN